jgi:hypothetical protein
MKSSSVFREKGSNEVRWLAALGRILRDDGGRGEIFEPFFTTKPDTVVWKRDLTSPLPPFNINCRSLPRQECLAISDDSHKGVSLRMAAFGVLSGRIVVKAFSKCPGAERVQPASKRRESLLWRTRGNFPFEDVAVPVPGSGDLLVQVAATRRGSDETRII